MSDTCIDICALNAKEQAKYEENSPVYLAIESANCMATAALLSNLSVEDYEITTNLAVDFFTNTDLLGEETVREVFQARKSDYECIYHYDVLYENESGAETFKVSSYRPLSECNEDDKALLTCKLDLNFNEANGDEISVYLITNHTDLQIKKDSVGRSFITIKEWCFLYNNKQI